MAVPETIAPTNQRTRSSDGPEQSGRERKRGVADREEKRREESSPSATHISSSVPGAGAREQSALRAPLAPRAARSRRKPLARLRSRTGGSRLRRRRRRCRANLPVPRFPCELRQRCSSLVAGGGVACRESIASRLVVQRAQQQAPLRQTCIAAAAWYRLPSRRASDAPRVRSNRLVQRATHWLCAATGYIAPAEGPSG